MIVLPDCTLVILPHACARVYCGFITSSFYHIHSGIDTQLIVEKKLPGNDHTSETPFMSCNGCMCSIVFVHFRHSHSAAFQLLALDFIFYSLVAR